MIHHIDAHHTVEDIAIVFGEALKQALEISAGLHALLIVLCLWMKHWLSVLLIFLDVLMHQCSGEPEGLNTL